MGSLCYEYQFLFILKLIIMTKRSHIYSLSKRDREELGNGVFEFARAVAQEVGIPDCTTCKCFCHLQTNRLLHLTTAVQGTW